MENVFGRDLDLTQRPDRTDLAERIKDDIDKFSLKYNDGHRWHLGASLIGHECKRYLWYKFRWVWTERFGPRLLRLFQRGKREEPALIELLRGIGFTVMERDENGKQFRVSAVAGHFGGSMDGKLIAPARYGNLPPFLAEFKTKGTGSAFTNLDQRGVEADAPQHYEQMSVYAWFDNIPFALYMVVNKNDDSLIVEIVEPDSTVAAQALQKANDIIYAIEPPKRLSESPSFFKCKSCSFVGGCHKNAKGERTPPEKNCRSCVNATPAADGEWFCRRWSQIIPAPLDANGDRDTTAILAGCGEWTALNV